MLICIPVVVLYETLWRGNTGVEFLAGLAAMLTIFAGIAYWCRQLLVVSIDRDFLYVGDAGTVTIPIEQIQSVDQNILQMMVPEIVTISLKDGSRVRFTPHHRAISIMKHPIVHELRAIASRAQNR